MDHDMQECTELIIESRYTLTIHIPKQYLATYCLCECVGGCTVGNFEKKKGGDGEAEPLTSVMYIYTSKELTNACMSIQTFFSKKWTNINFQMLFFSLFQLRQ